MERERAPRAKGVWTTTDWPKRLLLGGGLLVALVAAYLILAATIPRWWSQQVGDVVQGRLGIGFLLGLGVGLCCTLLPLVAAWIGLRKGRSRKAGAAWLTLALVLAQPNLWTLGVVVGGGSAAHAGQRVMDVNAPWFRGATLTGAILGAALFVGFLLHGRARRHRGRESSR